MKLLQTQRVSVEMGEPKWTKVALRYGSARKHARLDRICDGCDSQIEGAATIVHMEKDRSNYVLCETCLPVNVTKCFACGIVSVLDGECTECGAREE